MPSCLNDQGKYEHIITKTYLYTFDPLKLHFYIVKLGFTGVYIMFSLFLLKIRDCRYSLEPPSRGVLTSTHNLCFEQKYEKYQNFYLKIFIFFWWRNFQYIWITSVTAVQQTRLGTTNADEILLTGKKCKFNVSSIFTKISHVSFSDGYGITTGCGFVVLSKF